MNNKYTEDWVIEDIKMIKPKFSSNQCSLVLQFLEEIYGVGKILTPSQVAEVADHIYTL